MAFDSTNNTQSQIGNSIPSSNIIMANESTNNPFFLPANENPGLVLISQRLTGPENYMN